VNVAINWLIALLSILALQTSPAYFAAFYGIKPDFALIFVIYAGVAFGRTTGMTVGFLLGLFLDLLNIGLFGFNIFFLLFVGMFAGLMQKKVFKDSYVFPLILSAGFSGAQALLWMIAVFFGGHRITDLSVFLSAAWIKIVYNIIVTLPLFSIFDRVRRFAGK
jgi:rod shape-determining protein MreD